MVLKNVLLAKSSAGFQPHLAANPSHLNPAAQLLPVVSTAVFDDALHSVVTKLVLAYRIAPTQCWTCHSFQLEKMAQQAIYT